MSIPSTFPSSRPLRGPFRIVPALAVGTLACLVSRSAAAHITLMNPPSWVVEDREGDPQKAPPCGGGGTATNMVTTYRVGQRVEVQWKETIGHPGHFRIAIAMDRADFEDPPVVTSNGDGVSGNSLSAEIMNPVGYPVLLDGLFARASVALPEPAPFTQAITIPDMPGRATLQVTQFMAQHAPGYFYYHCADIEIVAADAELPGAAGSAGAGGSAAVGQAGSSSTAAGGTGGGAAAGAAGAAGSSTAEGDDEDDGGCSLPGGARRASAPAAILALLGLAVACVRRRAAR